MSILDNFDKIQSFATKAKDSNNGIVFGPERIPRNSEVKEALKEFGGEVVWEATRDDEWSIIRDRKGRVLAIADISGGIAVDVSKVAGRKASLMELAADLLREVEGA